MTYDPAEASSRDVVRGLIGDTGGSAPLELLVDATIDAVLARESNVFSAAAECADRIGALVRRRPESMTVGPATITRGQRPRDWHDLAVSLRQQGDDADARDGGLFDWAEQGLDDFSIRERLTAERLRGGV